MSGQPDNLTAIKTSSTQATAELSSEDEIDDDIELTSAEVEKKRVLLAQLQAIVDSDQGQYSAAFIEHMETSIVHLTDEIGDRTEFNVRHGRERIDQVDLFDGDDEDASIWEVDDAEFDDSNAMADESLELLSDDEEEQLPADAVVASAASAKKANEVADPTGAKPAVAPKAKPVTKPAVTAPATVKLAPNRPPVHGTPTVCGIAAVWTDNKGTSAGKVGSAARALSSNYSKLSRGQLKFKPFVKSVHVDYAHTGRNINRAAKQAKNKVGKFDRYVFVTNNIGTSHAGGNTAILRGALKRDWWHENGHNLYNAGKQAVLGHAGRYVTDSKGRRVLEAYGDGTSFMSRFSTNKINPPQVYWTGWAGDNKTGQYDIGDGVKEFNVEPCFRSQASQNLIGVYIPREAGRPMFVGIVPIDDQLLFGVWDMTGGGTQRETVFNKSATVAGLTFTRVQNNGSYSVLRIEPEVPAVPKAPLAANAPAVPGNVNKPHKQRPKVRRG